jgi:GNAT superfamily N-acetyltransferase
MLRGPHVRALWRIVNEPPRASRRLAMFGVPAGMNEALSIVSATEADLGAVAKLAGVIWRRHYPGIITQEQIEYMLALGYSHHALRRFLDAEGAGLDLARIGDRLAGFGAHCRLDGTRELKLDKLYVHQDFQGHGLGSRLIGKAESAARAQGCSNLVLNVNKRNVQAILAYERNGFAIREAVVVDIGGGFVMDDYVMAKPL